MTIRILLFLLLTAHTAPESLPDVTGFDNYGVSEDQNDRLAVTWTLLLAH